MTYPPRPPKRTGKPRKRSLSAEQRAAIHYTNPDGLRPYLTTRGRIRARQQTGLSRRDQRRLAAAVKLARELALLPYSSSDQSGERRRSWKGEA